MFLRWLRARGARIALPVASVAAIVAALAAGVHPLVAQPSTPPSTSGPPGFERLRKIDVHSHIYEDMPVVNAMLRRINLRVVNISNPGTDGHLDFMHRFNAALVKRHPDIFSFASTFDLTTRDQPGYGARVAKALDETFAQGAVMVKIWKEVGLELLVETARLWRSRAGDQPDKAEAVGREAALYDVRAEAKPARNLFAFSILYLMALFAALLVESMTSMMRL